MASAENSTNESITLIIRMANNKHPDFYLTLSPSSSVIEVKRHIALNHPTKALPKDQRLIFSGKLLDDANILNQVFIKSTSASYFMIHLVLSTDKNTAASTTKMPQQPTPIPPVVEKPSSSSSIPPAENVPSVLHSATYEQYLQELFKYQQQLQQFMINPNGSPPMPSYESQAYLQYCYTHYQMYQNLFASQIPVVSKPTPVISVSASAAAPSPPPQPAPAAPVPPPPAAAPANNNNNEFDQENDLLGTLHMLAELFVLCSIIYFYSTFNRFLVVFIIFVLLYMHCRGYLSIQRRRRAPPVQAPAAADQVIGNDGDQQPVPPVDAEQQAPEDEPDTDVTPPLIPNEPQNPNDLQRPQPAASDSPPLLVAPGSDNQITTARLLVTAVSTFFSSLIPERPQRM